MAQLKVKHLKQLFKVIKNKYNLTDKELNDLNIYLGDDEELNGIHYGLFCQDVNVDEAKGYKWSDMESGKITFDEYCQQSLQQDVKDLNEKQTGICILIS